MLAVLLLALLAPSPAHAIVHHRALTVHSAATTFYAGHLVLDAQGSASLRDATLRVAADRIIVDLRANHYVAAGNVIVDGEGARHEEGIAFGMDLKSGAGLLVSAAGKSWWGERPARDPNEPLALPDVAGEEPFAVASGAVAHLGADVRLQNARLVVAGSKGVYLPSYVYTFSSDTGYVINNVAGASEDLPVYVYSTQDSLEGIHFLYNPVTKVGVGLDLHVVDGQRAYDLISLSPLNGPTKTLNFTWQQQINDHTTQTFNSSSATGIGTQNFYDVRDSVHRSFFEFTGSQYHLQNSANLGWQSFDEPLGQRGPSASLYFHVRSDYGFAHVPDQFPFLPFSATDVLPATVFHTALEGYLATQPLGFGRSATVSFSGDLRRFVDTLPHAQTAQAYTGSMTIRMNRFVTTSFFDRESPIRDEYPGAGAAFNTHISTQTANLYYSHSNSFALFVSGVHSNAQTTNPTPYLVAPWVASADVRFRVGRRLSLDLSRSYYFGFQGQRFGTLGVQLVP